MSGWEDVDVATLKPPRPPAAVPLQGPQASDDGWEDVPAPAPVVAPTMAAPPVAVAPIATAAPVEQPGMLEQITGGYMRRLGEQQAVASQLSEAAAGAGDPFSNAGLQALAAMQGLYSPIGALFPKEEAREAARPYGPLAQSLAVGALETGEVFAPGLGVTKIQAGRIRPSVPTPAPAAPAAPSYGVFDQLGDIVRGGISRSRAGRQMPDDAPIAPEEIAEAMKSPEVVAILKANGINADDPRAVEAAAQIEQRLAAARAPQTTPTTDVSPETLFKDMERQRALQEAVQAGEVSPAFAPPAPAPLPEAFAVDPFGTARPASVQATRPLIGNGAAPVREVVRPMTQDPLVPFRRGPDIAPDEALEAATTLRARSGTNLPAVVERQREPMTDEAVAIAQRAMRGGDQLPETPSKLYGGQDRQPMDTGGLEAQARAAEAFTLADRQRQRLAVAERPGDVRDTQAAGLERGVEPVEVKLDQGNPVKVLGTEYARQGKRVVEVSRVRRYDPRTDKFDDDAIEYLVPSAELKTGKYTPEPRRAQEFVTRTNQPAPGEGLRSPERPRAEGGAPVRREPNQTFRATEPDPNAQFPAAGEGRSPLPPQPEPVKPRYSTWEELAADYQARQKQRRAEDAAREDRAKSSYKGAKSTNTPKGQDADGRWHIDSDGHVLSDKGGPVKFADQKQAARWILHAQKKSPDQNFEIVNHPGGGFSAREFSRTAKQETPNAKPQSDRTAQEPPREEPAAQPKEAVQLDDGPGGGRRADAGTRAADEPAADGPGSGGDRGAREGGERKVEPEPEVNARQGDDEPVGARPADRSGKDQAADPAASPKDDAPDRGEEPRKAPDAEEDDLDAQDIADRLSRVGGEDEAKALVRSYVGNLTDSLDDRDYARKIVKAATGSDVPPKTSIAKMVDIMDKWIKRGRPSSAPKNLRKQAAEIDEFIDTLGQANTREQAQAAVKHMDEMHEWTARELARRYGIDTQGMSKGDVLDAIKDAIKAGTEPMTSKQMAERAAGDATVFRSAGALTEEESKKLFKRVGELLFGDEGERARHMAGMTQIFGKGPKTGDALKRMWRGTTAVFRTAFASSHGNVMALSKSLKSPTMKAIADMFHAEAGATNRAIGKTFEEAVGLRITERMNDLSKALEPFFASPEQLEQITRMVQSGTGDVKTAMGKAAVKLREMLKEELAYLKEAGVEIGNVKTGYFPREFNRQAIMNDPETFVKAVAGEYRKLGDDAKTASAKAEALADAVLLGGDGAGTFRNKGASDRPAFTAGRAFEKAADARLRDFYVQDPVEVLSSYFMRATKRAEAARRFGDKWEKWADLEHKVRQEVGGRDGETAVNAARALAMSSTGMRAKALNPYMVTASEWLRAVTAMALLERVSISSLQELVMPGVRSGSMLEGFKSAVMTAGQMGAMIAGNKTQTMQFAEDLGIIYSKLGTATQTARFSGDDIGSIFLQRAQRNYFRNVGLEQLTNGTRGVAATSGQVMLRALVRDLADTLNKRGLRELGIPDAKQADFKKWLETYDDGMPGAGDIRDARKKGVAAADMYRTAVYRFVNQSVMNPTAATKPAWAQHPMGALVFQLNGFNYAFAKNVLFRGAKRLKQAVTDDELTAMQRAQLATSTVLPMAMLGAVGFGISAARDEIFRKHKRKETPADAKTLGSSFGLDTGIEVGAFKYGVRHASRVGAFGGADPWVNFFTGARYENSPVSALTGPMVGTVADLFEIVPELAWKNSDKTNTTERKFWGLVYDKFLEPAVNLGINAVAPANLISAAGVQAVGEGTIKEGFVSTLGGKAERDKTRREKRQDKREAERKERRADVQVPMPQMFAQAEEAPAAEPAKSAVAATRLVERNGRRYTVTKNADGSISARRERATA